MCVCTCVQCMLLCLCVYVCLFLDADKEKELVQKNVFLARKQQLFANWPFCQDNRKERKCATFKI